MNLGKIILFVFLVCLSPSLIAQNLNDAIFSKSATEFRFSEPILGLLSDRIDYDKIKGSPFWMDAYQPALLYTNTGYIGTLPVRLNFATGELYFLKDSEEVVLVNNFVAKIVFRNANDSSVFISRVPNLLFNNNPVDGFVQALNFGKYQLLKYTIRKLASEESPSHTSKNYYFTDVIIYFIKSNEKLECIKKLNKENIFFYLPSSSSYNAWLKENTINFKNEKDIVRFLNYYNAHLNNYN